MKHTLARSLLLAALAVPAFALLRGTPPPPAAPEPPPAHGGRVVYVTGGMSDEGLVTLSAAVAAADRPGVLLLDSEAASPYVRAFLAAYRPDRVVAVGAFAGGVDGLGRRLGVTADAVVPWTGGGPPLALWRRLFPRAEQVVVCPAEPRGQLLQAACLAGAVRAPLFVLRGRLGETARLRALLGGWETRKACLVGEARKLARVLPEVETVKLRDAAAVAAAFVKVQARDGALDALVVANPADTGEGMGGMAALAPWVALQKRAALVLTGPAGDDVEAAVRAAVKSGPLRRAEAVILVANLKAVPMRERPNPIPADKDKAIEMEPLTPDGAAPFTFATGRLFHEDRAVVPLLLARQHLLAAAGGPRRALVASNPGGGMSLLEAFSRNTARELRNAGYATTTFFGKEVNGDDLRRELPWHDVFLWEGHHNPLIKDYGMPSWDEPMPPSLVFLQSCLALREWKALPLLSRGAVGVVGSSTRTYSASGGACSLAFFDALLYEGQPVGAALRQAKNFLLAYALLKEKRLGKDAVRAGANLRSAWAFTLWGDPTLRLPAPPPPGDARPPARHTVEGNTIVLELPPAGYERLTSDKYRLDGFPNARLAGLLRKEGEGGKELVPLVFAEVHLPKAHPGRTPRLRAKLSPRDYVFCWDERRRCGYLLVAPPARAGGEIRFRVEWEGKEAGREERVAEVVGAE
jgi:hypothetical protein